MRTKTRIKPIHIATLLFFFFGLFVIRESRDLRYWSELGPGPGLLPLLLGVIISVLTFILMIEILMKSGQDEGAFFSEDGSFKKVGLVMIAYTALTALVNKLGFLLASALFMAFIIGIVERRSWINVLIITIFAVAGFYCVFVVLLNVPLPRGILGK
jgi:putative tricarboxylic transport membrane protein